MSDMTHIDWCIADEPEACEGECIEERIAEVEGELAEIRATFNNPAYDLTIETETRMQRREDELENELRMLNI